MHRHVWQKIAVSMTPFRLPYWFCAICGATTNDPTNSGSCIDK